MRRLSIFLFFCLLLVGIGVYFLFHKTGNVQLSQTIKKFSDTKQQLYPLSIQAMRARSYPGSDLTIEKTLPSGSNYSQYLTSYMSDGIKIYALLTVPSGQKPKNGWPVILFNHGYIAPETYQTFPSIGQYASYYPVFSSTNYIVFKPDYRGNGNSQGTPEGAYYSTAYTVDDLNALSSIKKYKDADSTKIGIWGHSMGGNITLRDLVVDPKDIKAAVIWGGVVGTYDDLMNNWQRRVRYVPSPRELALRNASRSALLQQYGTPQQNPSFWNSIDPNFYLSDVTAPVQLHAGGDDEEVPTAFSQGLYDRLVKAGKTAEIHIYPGADHNISQNFSLAMQRSLEFFNKYLK